MCMKCTTTQCYPHLAAHQLVSHHLDVILLRRGVEAWHKKLEPSIVAQRLLLASRVSRHVSAPTEFFKNSLLASTSCFWPWSLLAPTHLVIVFVPHSWFPSPGSDLGHQDFRHVFLVRQQTREQCEIFQKKIAKFLLKNWRIFCMAFHTRIKFSSQGEFHIVMLSRRNVI